MNNMTPDQLLQKAKEMIKQEGKTYFFNFRQNNSGGSFDDNDDVCEEVIIEAHSPEEANLLADNHGIYFDGCAMGLDCSCCGDRWYRLYEDEKGTDEPMIYSKKVKEVYKGMFRNKCIIYYLNGKKEKVIFKTYKDCPKHEWERHYNIGDKCKICGIWRSELDKIEAKKGV